MSDLDENQAMEQVVDRLAARFPSLPRERIRQVVDEEVDHLENGRIRDFVPVLVEHAATGRLREESQPVRVTVDDAGSSTATPVDQPGLDPMEVERREREKHGGFLFGDLGGGPS